MRNATATAAPNPTETPRLRELASALDCFLEEDLTLLYNVSQATCESWRKRGVGPRHIQLGRRPVYPRDAVLADLESRRKDRSSNPADLL